MHSISERAVGPRMSPARRPLLRCLRERFAIQCNLLQLSCCYPAVAARLRSKLGCTRWPNRCSRCSRRSDETQDVFRCCRQVSPSNCHRPGQIEWHVLREVLQDTARGPIRVDYASSSKGGLTGIRNRHTIPKRGEGRRLLGFRRLLSHPTLAAASTAPKAASERSPERCGNGSVCWRKIGLLPKTTKAAPAGRIEVDLGGLIRSSHKILVELLAKLEIEFEILNRLPSILGIDMQPVGTRILHAWQARRHGPTFQLWLCRCGFAILI
jgi:hypothetical protein